MAVYTSVVMLIMFVTVTCSTLSGTSVSGQSLYQFTYTTLTTSTYLHFQLYLTPFYSSGLLAGRTSSFVASTNRNDWQHYEYLQSNEYDYEGMVTARNQYAWVNNPGVGSTLYLKLINFEPLASFSYIINVTESSTLLKTCQPGLVKMPNQVYCAFCSSLFIGAFCEIKIHSIAASTQYLGSLQAQSYAYFLLLSQKEITLSLTYDDDIRVYVQSQQSSNDLAGIVNYFMCKIISSGTSSSMEINGGGKSILVSIINPNNNAVLFSLTFKEQKGVDIIIIITAVFASVIVLGIIFIAFIIFRKMKQNQQRIIHPQQPLFQRRSNNKFSPNQIEVYFPPIQMASILPQLDISSENLQSNQQKQGETQCVICLCPIQRNEIVRVGYCKHIFHSHCLAQWFKKQQNCPYCRRDYSRSSTAEQYNKLVKRIGRSVRGQQIPKSVFGVNPNASMNILSIETTKQSFQ